MQGYPDKEIGKINIAGGWIFIFLGILSGSILGLWSFGGPFPTPPGYEDYTALPRRLTRLAHIACFALPMISILYGNHIDVVPFSRGVKKLGGICFLVCMVGVPLFLFLASLYLPFKYVEVIPVTAGMIALSIIGWGHIQLCLKKKVRR